MKAIPATDSTMFDQWSGDASGTSPSIMLTIDSNKHVVATFVGFVNTPPNMPSNLTPANQAVDVSDFTLSWSGGDPDPGDTITYDVYFGVNSPPPLVSSQQSMATYVPSVAITALSGTRYYWQVVATDSHGASTEGPGWEFTIKGSESSSISA